MKALVPVIALSADRTLTSVNIPWIFRMPAGATVEDAVARMAEAVRKGGGDRGRVREALARSGWFGNTGEPAERR